MALTLNPKVDNYLAVGCGRCSLVGTPECKVNPFREGLETLRQIVLECGLKEELKWSQPCYAYKDKNVLIMSAFKDYFFLGFFKGALLKDKNGLLQKPGENSQSSRQLRFTNKEEVQKLSPTIKTYILEAITIEKQGLKVKTRKNPEPIPEELQLKFNELPALKSAFESLTPGRQRGYIIYFNGAKQSKTRLSRIEKYIPRIIDGKGFHDR